MLKRMIIVSFIAVSVVLFGLTVCFSPTIVEAQGLQLYDNFDGVEFLNPNLWGSGGPSSPSPVDLVDVIRRIDIGKKLKGELRLGARGYSWEEGGSGFSIRLDNPDGGGPHNIRAMEAEVKITESEFTQCLDGSGVVSSYFEMLGSFFSTGLGDVPPDCSDDGDNWHEVHAAINIEPTSDRDGNEFRVWARIYAHPYDPVNYEIVQDLGITVEKGETVTVGLRWDQANHSFIFQVDEYTEAISYRDWLSAEFGDTMAPCGGFKAFGVNFWFPECVEDESSMSIGSMEFMADNVRIESVPW